MLTDFRLKVFVTVAENLSFTKGSELLNITQPAVTKHIRELESRLGDALFVRHGNRISLTDAGETLLTHARVVLADYVALSEAFQYDTRQFEGSLRLGASTTIAQYLLPEILARFNKLYPKIEVTLVSGNSEEIARGLINQTLDFGMVEGNETNPSLKYEEWRRDEVVLVTATGNKRYRQESISVAKLCEIPLLVRETGSGTLSVVDTALQQKGIEMKGLNIQMRLGSSESIVRYLLHSHCFAFISLTAVADYLKEGKLRIVELEEMSIPRSFRFVALHGKYARSVELIKQFCLRSHN